MKTTDYIAYQDKLDREHQQRQQQVSAREFAQLERTTTTRHEPTQHEIEYRRFTSGGCLDNEKGK